MTSPENNTIIDGVIIGGGISGLSLAHWLGLHDSPGTWELWEATDRMGGTTGTDRERGYSVDWGPNGFLDREPLTLQLVDEIGLRTQLEPANDKSNNRFIAKNGALHPVPFSPSAMLRTGLLDFSEKLRIFAEPFIKARRDDSDESVFDFAARRIGRGAAETFVEPMVSGVYGGVARELSLPACFPVMRDMEVQYGGLVKAMIAKMREKRRKQKESGQPKKKGGSPAGPGGHLTSFKTGLDVLTNTLADRHRSIIRTNRAVSHVAYHSQGYWTVRDATGNEARARNVVVACPTFVAAQFLESFDRDLAAAFGDIPYAPIIVVATGHRREDIRHPLDGFGFLIPRTENIRTLGSIWTSSIFMERAPDGHVQFRSMLGGAGDPSVMELSDEDLWRTVKTELGPLVGITADPVFIKIYRWERGIPQFTLGHRERRTRIEQLAAKYPGFHMVGNAYYGVGLNDCVKMAKRVADAIKS
ncbi:MAG: protoporphyrinogen oxidase [Candidatus Zixiibacteriota bacterium]